MSKELSRIMRFERIFLGGRPYPGCLDHLTREELARLKSSSEPDKTVEGKLLGHFEINRNTGKITFVPAERD